MAGRLITGTVVASALLVGCADEVTFDTASLEDGLPAAVLPEEPDALTDVACPEADSDAVARSVICTANLHGDAVTIPVQVDDDGVVVADVSEPLLDLTAVAADLADRIEADLVASGASDVAVEVGCPGTVVVLSVGREIECSGGPVDDPRPLLVTIVAEDGTWEAAFGP